MNPTIEKLLSQRVETIEQLESLYGAPNPRSIDKEIDYISDHYRAFIEKSPFVLVATNGPEGLDCSPRGDPPGFMRVLDQKTVLMPDRRGNNRLDTLRNLVVDPRISLLFLIPGVGETLRINGRADIVTDPELRESFSIKGKVPATVIVMESTNVAPPFGGIASACAQSVSRTRNPTAERSNWAIRFYPCHSCRSHQFC